MIFNVRGFITSKEAEAYHDCADHYAYNLQTHRFAIADGVSKSFFPNLWSRILVDQSVAHDCATDFPLDTCQKEWLAKVTQRVSRPDVKWYTTNAFLRKDPALSTLVNLEFDEENQIWVASAIGDSFLFFVPEGKELNTNDWIKFSSKPEPVEFDNYPDYLSSGGEGKGEVKRIAGPIEAGTFYLMTDALAEWVYENKSDALQLMDKEWTDQKSFRNSVKQLRDSNLIHDDDSSVLIIRVEEDGITDIVYDQVEVSDLEDLIKMEETLQQCKDTISLWSNELEKTIKEIIHNANLSEYANNEIKEQLSDINAVVC